MDNTNWRAGGLEGRVSKWKTWTFGGLRPALFRSPAECGAHWSIRPSVQLASPRKIHVSSIGNTALQPAGPPFSVIQFYKW